MPDSTVGPCKLIVASVWDCVTDIRPSKLHQDGEHAKDQNVQH